MNCYRNSEESEQVKKENLILLRMKKINKNMCHAQKNENEMGGKKRRREKNIFYRWLLEITTRNFSRNAFLLRYTGSVSKSPVDLLSSRVSGPLFFFFWCNFFQAFENKSSLFVPFFSFCDAFFLFFANDDLFLKAKVVWCDSLIGFRCGFGVQKVPMRSLNR